MSKISFDDEINAPLDSCGNRTVAIIEIAGVLIPLCSSCLAELKETILNIKDDEI